ncbi:MAG TPA: Rrf2 family transcriptional regulator [Thermoanaerobaculia bacterium]|nr:Rrf2 family transcriptional regulator [Thermoanaerobaculia bacterium]
MPARRARRGPHYPSDLLQSPLYSHTCKEAFRVMERLAAGEAAAHPGAMRSRALLGEDTGLPSPALDQVLHFLEIAGLVLCGRAMAGAVRLARPASEISLLQVVRAIDGAGLWNRCILGFEECSDAMPCPAHPVWKTTRALLERHLDDQTIADLARSLKRRQRSGQFPAAKHSKAAGDRRAAPALAFDFTGDR